MGRLDDLVMRFSDQSPLLASKVSPQYEYDRSLRLAESFDDGIGEDLPTLAMV